MNPPQKTLSAPLQKVKVNECSTQTSAFCNVHFSLDRSINNFFVKTKLVLHCTLVVTLKTVFPVHMPHHIFVSSYSQICVFPYSYFSVRHLVFIFPFLDLYSHIFLCVILYLYLPILIRHPYKMTPPPIRWQAQMLQWLRDWLTIHNNNNGRWIWKQSFW